MDVSAFLHGLFAVLPTVLMGLLWLGTRTGLMRRGCPWPVFRLACGAGLVAAAWSMVSAWGAVGPWPGVLQVTPVGQILALLVQLLGLVIGGFSARYLQGEARQRAYVAALAAVLACVQLLVLADHWLLLIAAWAAIGVALQDLLCFYQDRPMARLAAHKKRIADRLADGLLVLAAALAWLEVGSGSLSALGDHVARQGLSMALQGSALALVMAVILRSASLPVHGWLIQVMEAPTPVSALLHAGVVNLGGFVLIRFAPLLSQADPARLLLLAFGLLTAVLAGMVMLTRVSIKVRLAWSTVAQMGFMLLECALGLYTLAALHLVGHSLYKAHAFLAASSVVRQTRLRGLHASSCPSVVSLVVAPVLSAGTVLAMAMAAGSEPWPWWWGVVLGFAWAPLLWWPAAPAARREAAVQVLWGLGMAGGLTAAALAAHALPLGLRDEPRLGLGLVALAGMAALYVALALLQWRPWLLSRWRRWSYAGFYVDEAYTRVALRLWPARWMPRPPHRAARPARAQAAADVPQ